MRPPFSSFESVYFSRGRKTSPASGAWRSSGSRLGRPHLPRRKDWRRVHRGRSQALRDDDECTEIRSSVLAGDVKDVLLLDVTPLSLGIETMGGIATKLIERNTTIPSSKSEVFSTAADNQPQVEIHVVQGERDMVADNKSLGRFVLDGIPSAPRGVPQIEVTFNIDANGILNVTAKDKGSGKEQSITIQGSSGLSKEEVEKMAKEAEANAEEDKKKREKAEAKVGLDNAIYSADKMKSENADKVSDDDKKVIDEAVEEAKKVASKEDADKDPELKE